MMLNNYIFFVVSSCHIYVIHIYVFGTTNLKVKYVCNINTTSSNINVCLCKLNLENIFKILLLFLNVCHNLKFIIANGISFYPYCFGFALNQTILDCVHLLNKYHPLCILIRDVCNISFIKRREFENVSVLWLLIYRKCWK